MDGLPRRFKGKAIVSILTHSRPEFVSGATITFRGFDWERS
jgi:hypothetical protein